MVAMSVEIDSKKESGRVGDFEKVLNAEIFCLVCVYQDIVWYS